MDQITLPFERQRETSRKAAQAARRRSTTDRARVLGYLGGRGAGGATDDEIEQALDLAHTTASARRRGLYLEGLVVWCGSTRPTRSGRPANVWLAGTEARHHHLLPVALAQTREQLVEIALEIAHDVIAARRSPSLVQDEIDRLEQVLEGLV
jgi:parvulin-like peptidyl-prolyl isomerase